MVRPISLPLDTMRAYRACLNCRNRKSKCDLDLNQGRPPCRRCQRENKECVLGESHRGGRRLRKKLRLDDTKNSCPSSPATPSGPADYYNNSALATSHFSPLSLQSHSSNSPHENRIDDVYSWNQIQYPHCGSESLCSMQIDGTNIAVANQQFRGRNESTVSIAPTKVHENITSASLDNTSDALEILARVADRVDNEITAESSSYEGVEVSQDANQLKYASKIDKIWSYSPLEANLINIDTIYSLFSKYEELYHPYFPIISRESFNPTHLPWMSKFEPHLFSAILTIASKDDEIIHQICYEHMQKLILMILGGVDASIEAVEGLLLLSQWVSRPLQSKSPSIGSGEEDRVAWMYIGTALRIANYIGLDRMPSKADLNGRDLISNRKQLVWAACYSCDRQVSIRVGKGFWTRGPGPIYELNSTGFSANGKSSTNCDDSAIFFKANLEMTQIFSNVHDMMYSSKGHERQEILEGKYAEYLDDFRASIQNWYNTWGTLKYLPHLKASLLLTYNYLRLYVNAFAYQAAVSRMHGSKDGPYCNNISTQTRCAPLIIAATPDARFIYEALDAAKSLISTFYDLVEPTTLRHMPGNYYLYIIYSAVFLYKVRITTTMTEVERQNIRTMIQKTIERLEKASTGPNHMGSRYSRLLKMLWRKVPRKNDRKDACITTTVAPIIAGAAGYENDKPDSSGDVSIKTTLQDHKLSSFQHTDFSNVDNNFQMSSCSSYPLSNVTVPNGFSWLDLGATWNFATQNNDGVCDSPDSLGDYEDEITDTSGTPGLIPWRFNNVIFGGGIAGQGEGGGNCGLIF